MILIHGYGVSWLWCFIFLATGFFYSMCIFYNSIVYGSRLQLRLVLTVGYIFNGTILFKNCWNSLFMIYTVCLQFKSLDTQGFYVMAAPR